MQDPLFVKQFSPSVSKQPLNTHYQSYVADSNSAGSISWNIDSPFAGALLDNEVYVEYKLRFNYEPGGDAIPDNAFRAMFEGGLHVTGSGHQSYSLPSTGAKLALRQGFAVHNALQNCEVVINGQSLRQTPNRYMAEFARFYGHPMELEGIGSMSGGCLDSGTFTSMTADHGSAMDTTALTISATVDATGGASEPVVFTDYLSQDRVQDVQGVYPAIVESRINRATLPMTDDRWHNAGFTKRVHRLQEQWRSKSAANAASNHTTQTRYAQSFELTVFERLPISPFLMWEAKDGKRSIPYVDKLELTLTFYNNAHKLMLQSTLADAVLQKFDYYTSAPIIHMKWYIPPPGALMPPEVSIPVSQYKETVRSVTVAVPAVTQGDAPDQNNIEYKNIRLQQIPDLFLIYVKPTPATFSSRFAAEHHLEITNCDITINGDTGKALRATSGELFAMYARNSPMRAHRKMEYDQWRKRYCTLALKPSDLGVRVPAGVNHGVTLDVTLTVKNWWAVPAVGIRFGPGDEVADTGAVDSVLHPGGFDITSAWEIHVLGIYDKYELTLTNRGNAQLKLQNVPSLDLPQSLATIDRSELRAQFA